MVRTIPITKARVNLGEVVKRVHLDKFLSQIQVKKK